VNRFVRSIAAAVGCAVLLGACDFNGAYDLPLPGHPVSADDSYQVTAEFHDILNVVPRSPVMVDDVVVGEVTSVERVGWHAKITMRVKDDVDLPDNAIAEIKQVSLLGEKYVALEPPVSEPASAGRLGDGDNIPLSVTGRNPEVEEVLGALSFLLSGGGVGQLATITHEANEVMDGRQDQLRSLMSSLDGVVGTLDDQKTDIINALDSLNDLAKTLNNEKDTIGDALDATGPAIKVLADQHDQLIGMLSSLDRLGRVGTRVINASKEDVLGMLKHLAPILNGLTGAGQQLGPGLNFLISFPFPKSANAIVQGDYADTIAEMDFNLEYLFKSLGIPEITLGDLGGVLGAVPRCLASGSLTSKACKKVLGSVDLLKEMRKTCKTDRYKDSAVCQIVNAVPDLGSLLNHGPLGDTLDGLLGGLAGGLTGDRSSYPTSPTDPDRLIGGTA
jgi:phospholipid/cholesterol/gamma-HCH transport system substrate-binding protein